METCRKHVKSFTSRVTFLREIPTITQATSTTICAETLQEFKHTFNQIPKSDTFVNKYGVSVSDGVKFVPEVAWLMIQSLCDRKFQERDVR